MKFLKSKSLAALSLALIVTLMPQKVDGAAPPKDPFSNFMQMRDYASVHKYRVINKNLYFQKDGETGRFERNMNPKRINPYVRSQIYNTTVALLDKNHFTSSIYRPKDGKLHSRVFVTYAQSEPHALSGSTAFDYMFYDESSPAYNSHISLTVKRLWFNDVSELKSDHAEAHYKSKLNQSIKAIFNKDEEDQVFKYVFDEYLRSAKGQTKNGTIKKKRIGNINIVMEQQSIPTFHFSYVRKP